MSFWNRRRAALAALTAAAGLTLVVSLRGGDEATETSAARMTMPPAANPGAKDDDAALRQTHAPLDGAQQNTSAAITSPVTPPVAPPIAPPIALAPLPPPPVAPAPPATVVPPIPPQPDRPIDILLTAPAEANNGSTFEIGLSVVAERPVQSALFHVSYDPAVLEPLDLVAPEGTASPSAPSVSAEVEVSMDLQQGSVQWPVVRFVAHTQAPESTQITVTAQAWDSAGNAIAVGAPASQTMVLWP